MTGDDEKTILETLREAFRTNIRFNNEAAIAGAKARHAKATYELLMTEELVRRKAPGDVIVDLIDGRLKPPADCKNFE